MGGDAFSSGPGILHTPRMPKAVYLHVKQKYHDILLQYFTTVTTPMEAPEKTDYGDVDYVVSIPKDDYKGPETLMAAFGAVSRRPGPTSSFAIPWPESVDGDPVHENATDEPNDPRSKFIQIDVAIYHNGDEYYEWEVFHKSHGDLWNMLGSTIRKFGLTANHHGLHLRIEDIELVDRKKSLIPLSHDPKTVLEFLGLDESKYWVPFDTVQDMFEYVAHCRFFWVKETEAEPEEELDADKKALKHNDRQRMRKRPLFRRWVEEFIPECRRQGRFLTKPFTRQETLQDVFQRFPGVKQNYDERLEAFLKAKQADELWRDVIKAGVPEMENHQFRSASIRGLKAIIIADDYSLGVVPQEPLKQQNGLFDLEKVKAFVSDNWQKVGALQLVELKVKADNNMAVKRLNKELKDREK